jgi:hypothetical protein
MPLFVLPHRSNARQHKSFTVGHKSRWETFDGPHHL